MPDPFAALPDAYPSIVMERAELVALLAAVAKVPPRTSTIPILENVLIQAAADGSVRFTTADMARWLAVEGKAEVRAAGAVTVPARPLSDMAGSMPEGSQVELSPRAGRIAVLGGRTRFSLPALPPTDFPSPPKPPKGGVDFEIPAETLRLLLTHSAPAAPTSDPRPSLNGINLRTAASDGGVVMIAEATNGHLTLCVAVPSPAGAVLPAPCLLPPDTVAMALGLLTSGDVAVSLSETMAAFEAPGLRLVTKLVDAKFPLLDAVISETLNGAAEKGGATLDVRGFRATLRRIQMATEARKDGGVITKEIRLTAAAAHGSIVVSTPPAGNDQAEAEEAVEAPIEGDFGTIGVNAMLMERALAAAPGETACLRLMEGRNIPLLLLTCPSPEHRGFSAYLTLHRI